MSDRFDGIQFRSMHTGVHHVAVFSNEIAAAEFYQMIDTKEEIDEFFFEDFDDSFVEIMEIDFRNPPYESKEMPLIIHNGEGMIQYPNIPDVYNY